MYAEAMKNLSTLLIHPIGMAVMEAELAKRSVRTSTQKMESPVTRDGRELADEFEAQMDEEEN
jgi:hypothetical protein